MNIGNYKISNFASKMKDANLEDLLGLIDDSNDRITQVTSLLKKHDVFQHLDIYRQKTGAFDFFINENFTSNNIVFWRSVLLDLMLFSYEEIISVVGEYLHFAAVENDKKHFTLGFAIFDETWGKKNRNLVDVVDISKAIDDYLNIITKYGVVQRNFSYYINNLIKSRLFGLNGSLASYSLAAEREGFYKLGSVKNYTIL